MKSKSDGGYILITSYIFLAALLALLAVYYQLGSTELATTRYSKDSTTGFYSAEAGLNLRALDVKSIFVGYNAPSGTSPSTSTPCENGDTGGGDYACSTMSLNNRTVTTYVLEEPGNPIILTIPPGEQYQNLNAQEYRYTVRSVAENTRGDKEAILELRFKSRLVPLFQFVAFYNKDLEIAPGPVMTLSGPLHTNGDLYLNANNRLDISGQVTTAGKLYRGRKNDTSCRSQVRIIDPISFRSLQSTCSSRTLIPESEVIPWNEMIQMHVDKVTVPEPEVLDATSGELYWDSADLRLALRLDNSNAPITTAQSSTGVYVMNADMSVNSAHTQNLHTCTGNISGRVVGTSSTFYNNREATFIRMNEVDMRGLLDCLHSTNWLGTGKLLSDNTDGGIVFHFTVLGPESDALPNNYGVRVRNAGQLQSTISGAPLVRGMTVVSDQGFYSRGNYNATGKIPAAVLCDTFNPLSNNWNLNDAASTQSVSNRNASNTTFYAAVLAGTDSTGGQEGSGGQGGYYNGGLENYPRFHERWSGDTFTYRGSFVSLNTPRHSDGNWVYGNPQYEAPVRDWDYDTDFNNAANLPPLTPRFVYLRQELFVRDFEQDS